MSKPKNTANPEVAAVFDCYPEDIKSKLMLLRQLVLDVAAGTEGVGELEETLKWGQPSYLTSQTGSGSTIRIDRVASRVDEYAMYFHCQTTLVDTFKEMYRDRFRFEGNRSIIFHVKDRLPVDELRHCISIALTYHLDKKRNKRATVNRHATRRPGRRAKAAQPRARH